MDDSSGFLSLPIWIWLVVAGLAIAALIVFVTNYKSDAETKWGGEPPPADVRRRRERHRNRPRRRRSGSDEHKL